MSQRFNESVEFDIAEGLREFSDEIAEQKQDPEQTRLNEAAEKFSDEATRVIKETFWQLFDEETKGKFPERHLKKIRDIIERKGQDTPTFEYLKGDNALAELKRIDIDWFSNLEKAKNGILIFELPPVLSKKWWRNPADSSNKDLRTIPWNSIYEKTRDALYEVKESHEKDDGLYLNRINPFYYHESGKYYYVWYVENSTDKEPENFEDDWDEYFNRKWIPVGIKELQTYTRTDLEIVCPKNAVGVYIGEHDRVYQNLGPDYEISTVEDLLTGPTAKTVDRIIFPYFPGTIGRSLSETELTRLFSNINLSLSSSGEAYIFPIPPEMANEKLTEWIKCLAPHLWQNGGDLDFEITGDFQGDYALRIKRKSAELAAQKNDETVRANILKSYNSALPHTEDGQIDTRATSGLCRQMSQNLLRSVSAQYPNDFDRAMLVESYGFGFKRDRSWGYHYYFLLRDIGGKYYLGSPANLDDHHTSAKRIDLFEGRDLQELLDRITDLEGGEWPSADFIDNCQYMPPVSSNKYASHDGQFKFTRGLTIVARTNNYKTDNSTSVFYKDTDD